MIEIKELLLVKLKESKDIIIMIEIKELLLVKLKE